MNKFFLLILCCTLSLTASAQKASKLYSKMQTAFEYKEYFDVLSFSDKLPKEEKTSPQYYRFLSLSFDSLRRYNDAIKYYTLYTDQTKDPVCQNRLAYLKDCEAKRLAAISAKFERIKDCPKCHGTDSISMDITCPKCAGSKIVRKRCNRCKGNGRMICGACAGTGAVNSGNQSAPCGQCMGTGTQPCAMYCDHGYILEDCQNCSSMGHVTTQVKCDKHE